jgi:hypothetical protein
MMQLSFVLAVVVAAVLPVAAGGVLLQRIGGVFYRPADPVSDARQNRLTSNQTPERRAALLNFDRRCRAPIASPVTIASN